MYFTTNKTRGRSSLLISLLSTLALICGMVAVAPTAQALDINDKVTLKQGEQGFRISNEHGRDLPTQLFRVEENSGSTHLAQAYCIEYDVQVLFGEDSFIKSWNDFPGNNLFKTDENVRQRIYWITQNSYPVVSADEIRARFNLSEEELPINSMIAQTQGAIWTLAAADFSYGGLVNAPDTAKANEKVLFEYLTGPENTGLAESTSFQPSLSIDSSNAHRADNGVMGPYVPTATDGVVSVTTTNGIIVDENGAPLDASSITNGTPFYLKVEETEGSATVTVSARGNVAAGNLVVTPTSNSHSQTVIISQDLAAQVHKEFTLSWQGTNLNLGTTATDSADSDKVLAHTGGKITDVIAYTGLIVGKEYTIKGELMERVEENGTVTAVPTGIETTKVFTPEQPDGEVSVEFEVPEGYAGKTLVVFETAYDAQGNVIAEHADINDKGQTIRVAQPWESGGAIALGVGGIVLGGLLLTALGFNLLTRTGTRAAAPLGEEAVAPAPETPTKGIPKDTAVAPAAAPAAEQPQLANTGVSGVLGALLLALVAIALGVLLVVRGRRA